MAEAAGILKLNERTIRIWINAGVIPALRIGRRVRIKRAVSMPSRRTDFK